LAQMKEACIQGKGQALPCLLSNSASCSLRIERPLKKKRKELTLGGNDINRGKRKGGASYRNSSYNRRPEGELRRKKKGVF